MCLRTCVCVRVCVHVCVCTFVYTCVCARVCTRASRVVHPKKAPVRVSSPQPGLQVPPRLLAEARASSTPSVSSLKPTYYFLYSRSGRRPMSNPFCAPREEIKFSVSLRLGPRSPRPALRSGQSRGLRDPWADRIWPTPATSVLGPLVPTPRVVPHRGQCVTGGTSPELPARRVPCTAHT